MLLKPIMPSKSFSAKRISEVHNVLLTFHLAKLAEAMPYEFRIIQILATAVLGCSFELKINHIFK
jgi:hypothetical protein